MIGRLHHVVLDCPDPAALAAFYSALLGLPITYRDQDWVVVAANDTSSGLAFQLAPGHRPPTWPDPAIPQQVHLDVMVEDVTASAPRVLALGATRLDGDVFADPAGHPFCLIKRPSWAAPIPASSDVGGYQVATLAGVRFAGQMRIERFDPETDPERVRDCFKIFRAAESADDPDGPPMSPPVFEGWLRTGWIGDPRETWFASAADDTVVGWYLLELPARDNRHLAHFEPRVWPDRRRQGYGTALLQHAAGRALADGRSLLASYAWERSAGEKFARSLGATPGIAEIRRVLDLDTVPAERFAELRAAAEQASAGYSLTSWAGSTPEKDLDQVAAINRALADAPHDPSWEPSVWDAERVRETDRRIQLQGVRPYSVAARHDATGELAGLTQVEIPPGAPGWAFQGLTAVVRAHRGHRLGLLLKVAMLEQLAEAEPDIQRIITGNADGNRHMIAINEALGYRLLGQPARGWELPVADVLPRVSGSQS
jgi:RimJ/RimL family protein N-acetyltransferase